MAHTHEKAHGIVFFRKKIKNSFFFEILGSELRAPHSFPTVLGKKELKTAISSEFLAIWGVSSFYKWNSYAHLSSTELREELAHKLSPQ